MQTTKTCIVAILAFTQLLSCEVAVMAAPLVVPIPGGVVSAESQPLISTTAVQISAVPEAAGAKASVPEAVGPRTAELAPAVSENQQREAAVEKADSDIVGAKKHLRTEIAANKRKLRSLKRSAPVKVKFDLLEKAGDLAMDDQDYGQAIRYYESALSVARDCDDKDKTMTQSALNALAASYVAARKFDKACPLYEDLVTIIKQADVRNESELFWVLLDLALVYGELNKVSERQALAPELLSLLEKKAHQEFLKEQNPNARPLPFTIWKSVANKPKCIVLCVHGLGLHSASFELLAKKLNAENVGVFAIDVRGFGAWQMSRAQRVISPERTLHDIDGFLHLLHDYQPNTPVFLLGESMGGAIVLRYAAMHEHSIAGVISSVPADRRFNEGSDALRVVLNFFKNKNKRISVVKTLSKAASLDSVPEDLLTDPLIRAEISPEELIKFQLFMEETAKMADKIVSTPVLMLQGMKDKLAKPDATIDIYNNIKAEDKFLLLAGDCQHLIFEEVQTPPFVFASLLEWLDKHLDSTTSARESGAEAAVKK
ncbi:MAG TPA: alpha/beta fold hydrolase [Drouetiella sp.]